MAFPVTSPPALLKPQTRLLPAEDRQHTPAGWLDSRHCFSFGSHYDPRNTHFGLLLVSNDDVVAPGTGFDTHPHQDASPPGRHAATPRRTPRGTTGSSTRGWRSG